MLSVLDHTTLFKLLKKQILQALCCKVIIAANEEAPINGFWNNGRIRCIFFWFNRQIANTLLHNFQNVFSLLQWNKMQTFLFCQNLYKGLYINGEVIHQQSLLVRRTSSLLWFGHLTNGSLQSCSKLLTFIFCSCFFWCLKNFPDSLATMTSPTSSHGLRQLK